MSHVHDLVPVLTLAILGEPELVASLCQTCWAQCSPSAWVRQNDRAWDRHVRDERIEACGEHDRDLITAPRLCSTEVERFYGSCRKGCGA